MRLRRTRATELATPMPSRLQGQLAQHVELPRELQAQRVVDAVERVEDLTRRTDSVRERGSVGGAGVLIQPILRTSGPVQVGSLERRQLRFVTPRAPSQFVPFDEERTN